MTLAKTLQRHCEMCEDILNTLRYSPQTTTIAEYEEMYQALLETQDDIFGTLIKMDPKPSRDIQILRSMQFLTVTKGRFKRKAALIDCYSRYSDIKADQIQRLVDSVFND